jgi:phosphopentomutase
MGAIAPAPLPTYPGGFPDDVLAQLERATGRRMLCNRPYNGIDAIADYGEEHLREGALIVYTSQDSVLQIAAHVDRLAPEDLYLICRQARMLMIGEHAVGRVIARPFQGEPGAFTRTDGRRDFALPPPTWSHLEALRDEGVPVHAVGKVSQLFAGVGIDRSHPGPTNAHALEEIGRLVDELETGLVFANLIETDQVFGHRNDHEGFARALELIDAEVGK